LQTAWRTRTAEKAVALGTYRELVGAAVLHRDIVRELAGQRMASDGDYEWLRHLRHYWDPDVDQCLVAGETLLATGLFSYR
jgi:hypothetical protein